MSQAEIYAEDNGLTGIYFETWDFSEDLLNMKLTDMFCKHVIRRNPDGIQIKYSLSASQ